MDGKIANVLPMADVVSGGLAASYARHGTYAIPAICSRRSAGPFAPRPSLRHSL